MNLNLWESNCDYSPQFRELAPIREYEEAGQIIQVMPPGYAYGIRREDRAEWI